MYLTTQGLVLRVCPYNESDAMLTVLTGEQGRISVKARGIRRKNSPLSAPCQLLSYSEFTLFSYKDSFTINEAHSVELFTGLRRDLQKLTLGTYFAQAAEVLSQEDFPSPELLSLTLNCLHALCKLNLPEAKVKAVFELRSACLAGFTPDLNGCHICGNPSCGYLDVSQGTMECDGCRMGMSSGLRVPVSPGVLDAMRYICSCDSKKIFAFQLPDASLEQLSGVTETFFSAQLERGFSALDFYKSLLYQSPIGV